MFLSIKHFISCVVVNFYAPIYGGNVFISVKENQIRNIMEYNAVMLSGVYPPVDQLFLFNFNLTHVGLIYSAALFCLGKNSQTISKSEL